MAPLNNGVPSSHTFTRTLMEAYEAVGAYEPDIVYVYSDFRTLGRHIDEFRTREDFCGAVAQPLLDRGKTVVISTFTYTATGRFDVLTTPTTIGALNKWILGVPGVKRSEHPLFSYAAIGPQASLVERIGKSAFGADSVFTRLHGRRAAFLYVGRPIALGNTMLHHIEQTCGATYRVHKAFNTEVYRGEQYVGTDYSAFLRRRDVPGETFEFTFRKAAARLQQMGLVKQVGSDADLTNISLHWLDRTADALTDMFYENPKIFILTDFIQY